MDSLATKRGNVLGGARDGENRGQATVSASLDVVLPHQADNIDFPIFAPSQFAKFNLRERRITPCLEGLDSRSLVSPY